MTNTTNTNNVVNSVTFERELNYIKNEKLRNFTGYVLDKLPDYFRHIGASSSEKYHSKQCLGEGGLMRHTKFAVAIAQDLFTAEIYDFIQNDRDIVTSALILHDGLKRGMYEDHTAFDHPLLMENFIYEMYEEYIKINHLENINNITDLIFGENIRTIAGAVASHMGKWTTSKYSDTVLPRPKTDIQKCVHLCDYIASRKHLIFDFDVYDHEMDELDGGIK